MTSLWGRRGLFKSWIALFLFAVISTGSCEGNPNRRWSIRKTGEFGRRIGDAGSGTTTDMSTTYSQDDDVSSTLRQFRMHEPRMFTAESRRYESFFPVRRPSISLELPRTGDQEAQETDPEGYAYAPPEGGYDYQKPDPIPKDNPPQDDEVPVPPPSHPDPVDFPIAAGIVTPLETAVDIDSQGLGRPQKPPSSSPQVAAVPSDHSSDHCNPETDENCWPHGYAGVIPGEAGVDYPILHEIVPTSFSCDEQDYSGYYADTDESARCQIFHICLKRNRYRRTQQWSFLCPNGTTFSQSDFVCVWWTDAPECNGATVRSLYSLNEQLGWDNITEGGGRGGGGDELQVEMSGRNSAFVSTPASQKPTTYRPKTTSSRTSLPYRVPVKVSGDSGKARTKLQEVTQNALHGQAHELDTEHEVEESSNFETSLRQQSESRHQSKTASALHKSKSEAYELKGSPDGIQPFVVNRPRGGDRGGDREAPTTEYPPGGFDDQHQVVMMPTLQRFPDGSEGYAEVPVMMPTTTDGYGDEAGYRYPTPKERFEPNSTPAPTYLPPFESQRFSTTEDFPTPTIPTEPSLEDGGSTTEQSPQGYNYQQPENTGDKLGSYYQEETTTEGGGYQYPQPNDAEGYQYPKPEKEEGYQYPKPEEEEGYQYPKPEQGYQYPMPEKLRETTTQEPPAGGYQYPNPTEGYQYPEPTGMPQREDEAGYQYPNPTQSPNKSGQLKETTTEQSGYQYPDPTASAQESNGYQYPNPNPTGSPAPAEGYQYPNPGKQSGQLRETTTEQTTGGYQYPNPTGTPETEAGDGGYQYPNPNPTNPPDSSEGYQYPNPNPTNPPDSEGYQYPNPEKSGQLRETTTQETSTGYQYPTPTTTDGTGTSEDGYVYTTPTTTEGFETTTTEPSPSSGGYQYPTPAKSQQLVIGEGGEGYNYPTPTTTTEGPTTTLRGTTDDYQITNNFVSDSTDATTTEQSLSTTTVTATTPPKLPQGSYLPPSSETGINEVGGGVSESGKQGDEDTVDIAAEGDGDYPDSDQDYENEVPGGAEEGGYSYHLPTPPSDGVSGGVGGGGGSVLDSDERVSEILKQIQNGGIEAVDSSGKPIPFAQLKELLLNSPKGSVELKGEGLRGVDSVTSSSTEVPTKKKSEPEESSGYHTVTTATITNSNNDNVIFQSNRNQVSSPSNFFVLPNNSPPQTQPQHPSYYSSGNAPVAQPDYEIRLPNREFESHFVETNTIDSNSVFPTASPNNNQYQQQQPVQQLHTAPQPPPPPPRVQYQTAEIHQQQPQLQYYQSQPLVQNPTSSTSGGTGGGVQVIPSGNYLPPPQRDFERQNPLNNVVFPAVSSNNGGGGGGIVNTLSPERQYLPPIRAQTSLISRHYYNTETTATPISQSASNQFVSPPIQLTENLQLQQSYSQPLPLPIQPQAQTSSQQQYPRSNNNPLINPKDIKIVPAVFVHQHTSVASQNGQNLDNQNQLENALHSLETSRLRYQRSETESRFGVAGRSSTSTSQLNQNQVSSGRQFSRRSNNNNNSERTSSASSSLVQNVPPVSTFTLEDARSPDELQKYHHQDLKRFHTENIVNQRPVVEESESPTVQRAVLATHTTVITPREHRPNNRSNSSRSGGGSIITSSSPSASPSFSSASTRFNILGNDSSSRNRSRTSRVNNEDFFVPVSGSYGGGGGGGGGRSSRNSRISRNSNSIKKSRGGSSGRRSGGRGFDSESEFTLLSRFLPEEEGGFGAKL